MSQEHNNEKEQLVWKDIKDGKKVAFEQLYQLYADCLFDYGMKIASDDDLVTETIQALFVYIYEKRKTLTLPESVPSYMYISFRRMLFVGLKKKQRTDTIREDLGISQYGFELELDVESAIVVSEQENEKNLQLKAALDILSPQQREIIYMKYYKQLKNEEISNILGITNQVVRNVASQAMQKLRSYMIKLWFSIIFILAV